MDEDDYKGEEKGKLAFNDTTTTAVATAATTVMKEGRGDGWMDGWMEVDMR